MWNIRLQCEISKLYSTKPGLANDTCIRDGFFGPTEQLPVGMFRDTTRLCRLTVIQYSRARGASPADLSVGSASQGYPGVAGHYRGETRFSRPTVHRCYPASIPCLNGPDRQSRPDTKQSQQGSPDRSTATGAKQRRLVPNSTTEYREQGRTDRLTGADSGGLETHHTAPDVVGG